MDVWVYPHALSGTWCAPPSKSAAHRLLICSALSDCSTSILGLSSLSEDLLATVSCLRKLGAEIEQLGNTLAVRPISRHSSFPTLFCGESGSTLRFLLPIAHSLYPDVSFDCGERLRERPLLPLVEALKEHGVSFTGEQLPFCTSGHLQGGNFRIAANISSQFVSGLLMALPLLHKDSILTLTTPLESAPYVEMTLDILRQFGIAISYNGDCFFIKGNQQYHSPKVIGVEGDWSQAAFFLAAGAIGGTVTADGLRTDTTQGDRIILDLLSRFGAKIVIAPSRIYADASTLSGGSVELSNCPDLLPALAVVAANASDSTHFTHAGRLRLKESDRLATTAAMIRSLGGNAEETEDGLWVQGGGLKGGEVQGYQDHRIVMAAAIAAAYCTEPVLIRGADAVNKSYPAFFRDFQQLGGLVNVM